MVEPTGHCPYLGLKQNRAIRFASPTPEHRCYVSGEPLEIPMDQGSYCLSPNHVHCPLYMGLSVPTIGESAVAPAGSRLVAPQGGLRGWLATLSARDRAIYALMLAMLALIVAIYLIAGLQTFFGRSAGVSVSEQPTLISTAAPPEATEPAIVFTAAPAATVPPTPTNLPTSTPSPVPTEQPTQEPLVIPPTQPAASPPATSAPAAPTAVPVATSAPTSPPATSAPAAPTAAPVATSAPTSPPIAPTAAPTSPPRPPLPPTPTQPPPASAPPTQPPVSISTETLTLYFGDATGTLYVPVQRRVSVENKQVARAAIRELIAGPPAGLTRLVLPNVEILGIQISNGTATVNFDRRPTGQGDVRGFYAIMYTLIEFPSIERVQFQINGQNIGVNGSGPLAWTPINPLNPQGLPVDYSQTEFLPLYFVSDDGRYDIRILRMVPKTRQVAEATVRALLEGPGSYDYAVQRVIPEGTDLRGIRLANGIVIVDFTQPFAGASDRAAAVRTVVESLTTLRGVNGVQFLVEGRSLGEYWGGNYGDVFGRPPINPR